MPRSPPFRYNKHLVAIVTQPQSKGKRYHHLQKKRLFKSPCFGAALLFKREKKALWACNLKEIMIYL